MRRISMATRDELVAAVAERYALGNRVERGKILDESRRSPATTASTRCGCSGLEFRAVVQVLGRTVWFTVRRCVRR